MGRPGGQGWNAPTWTLSALLGCYVLLPWICRVLWRLRPWTVVVGSVLLVLVADWASRSWLGDPLYRLPLRFGFIRALPLFLLGVTAALIGARLYVPSRWAGVIGLVALAGLVVAQAIGDLAPISLILLTILIWAAGALPVARPSRLIEQLGLMAFAMFLTNEVTRIIWFGTFDALGQADWSTAVRWGVWGAGLTTAFIGAAIFRYGFDRPVQAWLNPPRPRTPLPGTSADRPIA